MAATLIRSSNPTESIDPYNLHAAPSREEAKRMLRRKLVRMPRADLIARLKQQLADPRPPIVVADDRDWGAIDRGYQTVMKRVLDTGGSTTGGVLPRVDLEQTIMALD